MAYNIHGISVDVKVLVENECVSILVRSVINNPLLIMFEILDMKSITGMTSEGHSTVSTMAESRYDSTSSVLL